MMVGVIGELLVFSVVRTESQNMRVEGRKKNNSPGTLLRRFTRPVTLPRKRLMLRKNFRFFKIDEGLKQDLREPL